MILTTNKRDDIDGTFMLDPIGKQFDAATVKQQLTYLAGTACSRLDDPSPEMMAALCDVLERDLVRTGSNRFEGTGVIPIPEDGGEIWPAGPDGGQDREDGPDGGEIWLETPRRPLSNLTGLRFSNEVTAYAKWALGNEAPCRI
jgi:hypothetical protein